MMILNFPTQSSMVDGVLKRFLKKFALWTESLTESALPWKYLVKIRNEKDHREERSP